MHKGKLVLFVALLGITLMVASCGGGGGGGGSAPAPSDKYAGTFTGGFSGTWEMSVDSAGNITGTFKEDGFGDMPATGKLTNGNITGQMVGGGVEIDFTGTVDSSGKVNGTWSNVTIGKSGTFTGSKK